MAKTKKQRDSVVFYRSFYEAVKELEPAQQAEVYNAVFEFALNGTEPKMSGIAKSIFTLIKPQILANNARYFNGQKGGRPKKDDEESGENDDQTDAEKEPKSKQKQTEQKPNQNQDLTKTKPKIIQTETKAEPNENDNVNDNDLGLKDRMDIEGFDCCVTRAHDSDKKMQEVIHKHLNEVLNVKWLRQRLESSAVFNDRLPLFDEYVSILEQADTTGKVNALLKLDAQKFSELFNALFQGEIENNYRYVWKSVIANAKQKKAG